MNTNDEDIVAWRNLAKIIIDNAEAFYLVTVDGEIKGELKLQGMYPVRNRRDAETIRAQLQKVLDAPISDNIK